jgi:hypothetical protein
LIRKREGPLISKYATKIKKNRKEKNRIVYTKLPLRKYVENLEHRIEQMENLIRKQAPSKQSHESPENAYQRPFEELVNIQPLPQQQQQQQEQHTFIHESSLSSLSSLSSATPSPIMNDTTTHQQILPDPMIIDNSQMLNRGSIPTTSTTAPEGGSTPSDSPSNSINRDFDRDFDLILEEMNGLTIRDYQRTRYVGYSLGLQCLGPNFFRSNRKHRLLNEPNWFVQKINHEDEEHVIMKTKEIMQPQFLYHEPTLERFKRLKDPCMTDELADFLIHV